MLQIKSLSRHSERHIIITQLRWIDHIQVFIPQLEHAIIQSQMSFFRLPTEVRQRIFVNALGGFLLRRRVIANGQCQWVCYAPSNSSRRERTYDQIEDVPFVDRLGILRVCRVFYKEAAEIPISESTFYFDLAHQFPRFLGYLRTFQRHALREYILQWGLTTTKYTNGLWPLGFEAHEINTIEISDEDIARLYEGITISEVCAGIR